MAEEDYIDFTYEVMNSVIKYKYKTIANYTSEKKTYSVDIVVPLPYKPRRYFSKFPDEILLKILRNLDIRSLCRMARVNKRFNVLTQDPYLFKSLKFRNMCYRETQSTKIKNYFRTRSESLRHLNISWTSFSLFPSSFFSQFLVSSGKNLTYLQLSNCESVSSMPLEKISECQNLKTLDLSYCDYKSKKGYFFLGNLERLEELNLSCTYIRAEPLKEILRKNHRLRKLYFGSAIFWHKPLLTNEVLKQAAESCPNLEVLKNLVGVPITSRGIDYLAKCKNLWKLYVIQVYKMGDFFPFNKFCVDELLSFCEHLEEINGMSSTQWRDIVIPMRFCRCGS